MAKFNHLNVMKLIGVCPYIRDSLYIVMPYMTHGSLLSYLRKHRADLTIVSEDNDELVSEWYIYRSAEKYVHVGTKEGKGHSPNNSTTYLGPCSILIVWVKSCTSQEFAVSHASSQVYFTSHTFQRTHCLAP